MESLGLGSDVAKHWPNLPRFKPYLLSQNACRKWLCGSHDAPQQLFLVRFQNLKKPLEVSATRCP